MRPQVSEATISKALEVLADAERMKATAKADRPGQASMEEIHQATAKCLQEAADSGPVVSDVSACHLPSDHLAQALEER